MTRDAKCRFSGLVASMETNLSPIPSNNVLSQLINRQIQFVAVDPSQLGCHPKRLQVATVGEKTSLI